MIDLTWKVYMLVDWIVLLFNLDAIAVVVVGDRLLISRSDDFGVICCSICSLW